MLCSEILHYNKIRSKICKKVSLVEIRRARAENDQSFGLSFRSTVTEKWKI